MWSELGVIVVVLFHFSLPNLAIALRAPNSVLATAGIIQMQVNSIATPPFERRHIEGSVCLSLSLCLSLSVSLPLSLSVSVTLSGKVSLLFF